MLNLSRIVSLALIAAFATGGTALAQTTHAAQKQVLLETSSAWNGSPYTRYPASRPQLTTMKLTIPPHTALPWHTHPIPEVGYVAAGSITLEDGKTGKRRTFHAGEAFGETVNGVHRGVTGNRPTILVVTYIGTPGVPTSIPARGAGKEY